MPIQSSVEMKGEQAHKPHHEQIREVVEVLDLDDTVEQTAIQLFDIVTEDTQRGQRPLVHITAAVLQAANRIHQAGTPPKDINAAIDGAEKKYVDREMNRLQSDESVDGGIPLLTASALVADVVDDLGGDSATGSVARSVAREIEKNGYTVGNAPTVIAGAVIYVTFRAVPWDTKRTQREIAETAEVREMDFY